jgi:hypothetical protein
MCAFLVTDLPGLRQWAPEALVLPLDVALFLADRKQRGLFDLPSLNTAILVLTRLADSPLPRHHRDLLWRSFGVPVFEQLLGPDGVVIGSECEVHDGLHVDNGAGMPGEIVTDHCACGLETPRLRPTPVPVPVRIKPAIVPAPRSASYPARSGSGAVIALCAMGYFAWTFIRIHRERYGTRAASLQ